MPFRCHLVLAREATQGTITGSFQALFRRHFRLCSSVVHGVVCRAISGALQMRFRCGLGVVFPSFNRFQTF